MKEQLKQVGAFSILLAVFMAGVAISNNNWSAANLLLQTDLRHAQDDVSRARAELADLKISYSAVVAEAKREIPTSPTDPTPTEQKPTRQPLGQKQASSSTVAEPKEVNVKLQVGESSGALFDDGIVISLIAVSFEGPPYRHKVFASIGGNAGQSVSIDKQDVGFSVDFKGKVTYRIRIVSSDTFSAGFQISPL